MKKRVAKDTTFYFPIFKNEADFAVWFAEHYYLFGIKKLIKITTLFPDIIAEMWDGRVLCIELEYHCQSFIKHGHDSSRCDLIISFLKPYDITKIHGIPVISLYNVTSYKKCLDFDYSSLSLDDFWKNNLININNDVNRMLIKDD